MNMLNKYPDKVKSNKRRLIININKSNLSDDNYNHFLNGEDLELPTFKKNNYQNQFINRKLFLSNSKKKKNKYILNFEHYNNEENRMKNNNNNYYSNSSKIPKNIENDFINDSLTDNYDHLKNNNNIKDILLRTKKEIQSSNKKREEIQKIEKEDKNNYKYYKINKSNNKINQNKNEINELNNKINFNYNKGTFNEILINDIDKNKNNNIQKRDFIIDKNEQNVINIKGSNFKKDLFNIKIDEFSKDYKNKLNTIRENNKNKSINVEQLINELYEYKVKYEKLKLMLNSKSSKKEKQEINDNLSKIKEENSKLNLQKKFLINELTKSVYNIEILRHKYKNELDRFSSYLNKIKYDLKEKSIESNI